MTLPTPIVDHIAPVYFVAISEQGPSWDASRGMREQQYWTDHVTFINGLIEDKTLLLGGPLADSSLVGNDSAPLSGPVGEDRLYRAILIVDGTSRDEVRRRLAEDPWVRNGLLATRSIDRWEVLVGDPAGSSES